MKNLKFLFLILLGATVGLTSCDKSTVDPSDDEAAYTDFLFFATADSSNGHGHHRHNLTEIEISALPANVTSYISSNYSGATIDKAAVSDSGKYSVRITFADSTHKGLLFDANGNFISEHTGKGKGPDGEKIDPASLPSTITDYITANYAGSEIKGAHLTTDGKYGVLVKKSDSTMVLLGFDAGLKFLGETAFTPKRGKGKGKGKGNHGH